MLENRLKHVVHKIDKKQIREILNSYFYFDDFDYSVIEAGYENLNIEIKIKNNKYLLRIYNEKQFDQHLRSRTLIEDELKFMNLCSDSGVPVPKVLLTKEGDMLTTTRIDDTIHFAAVFEFIKGSEIKRFNKKKIEAVALLQAQIHKLTKNFKFSAKHPIDGYLNHQNWLSTILKNFEPGKHSDLFDRYLDLSNFITEKLSNPRIKSLKTQPIHGDIHEGNMRFIGNEISGLFDFDDCRTSIISEDIGMFLSVILRLGDLRSLKDKINHYFNEYEKVSTLSEFEKKLALYFAVEKRLIPRINDLKDDIQKASADEVDCKKALEQMWLIIQISEGI